MKVLLIKVSNELYSTEFTCLSLSTDDLLINKIVNPVYDFVI